MSATEQQAVTVAQEDISIGEAVYRDFLMGNLDHEHGEYEGERCAIEAAARVRLASVSSASAETRKDTVAFVQEWLMNADYDPSQFDKDFAAAIDARHGFDDAALTAMAERFCAAPLPDTVCADLVAIKPMAGRSGTNLMTVVEAKSVLRSILPEPVPATNQAGEVIEAGKAVLEGRGDGTYAEAEQAIRGLIAHIEQPATSQEGEGTLANPSTFGKPTFGLAATPTPPTLSEDLREELIAAFGAVMFGHIWESFTDDRWDIEINDLVTVDAVKAGLVKVAPYDPEIHNDQSGAAEVGDDFYEITPAGRAALAQVKAS